MFKRGRSVLQPPDAPNQKQLKGTEMATENFKAAQAAWSNVVADAQKNQLSKDSLLQLQQGAALLLAPAKADQRPQAREVEAWLENMGIAASLGLAAFEATGV